MMTMKNILLIIMLMLSFSISADWQQPELSHNLTVVTQTIPASNFELENMDEEK